MKIEELINTVNCADCLDFMPNIPDKSIDMILADLPYGTTRCKWDTIIPFEPLWEQYKRIIKDNGAIVLTASQPFTSALVMSNIKMFKYCWIWEKTRVTGFLDCKRKPLLNYEDVCVFSVKQSIYNPQGLIKGKFKNSCPCKDNPEYMVGKVYGKIKQTEFAEYKNYPRRIIEFSNPNNHSIHPTQKPVTLFEYLIRTYTSVGDVVLDNVAGSGTTAIACINTKRNYILIEKDKHYCEIINNRIKEIPERLL